MRVLLATTGYPPEHSGSGGRLHDTYTRLRRLDPALVWRVVTRRQRPDLPPPDGPEAVCAFLSPPGGRGPAAVLRELLWLRRALADGLLRNVDLLHCAGWSWFTPMLCRRARRAGVPILREMTTAADLARGRGPGAWLVAETNRMADQLIAISPALRDAARARNIAAPVWCRPNGVDPARFHAPSPAERRAGREALARHMGATGPDDIVILQAGRLRPLKGQEILIDAMAQLPPRFRALIVGPPPEGDDRHVAGLRSRIDALSPGGRVTIVPERLPEIEALMHGADMLAMPSESEGLGTVMIEALACGLPVVASRLPGVTDWIIEPGRNGALVPREAGALARAITDCVPLLAERDRIATDAGRFACEDMDRTYLELIARLTGRADPAAS